MAKMGCSIIIIVVILLVIFGMIQSCLDETDNCLDEFDDAVWSQGRAALNFPDTFDYEPGREETNNGDGTVTYVRPFSGSNAFGVRTTLYAIGTYRLEDCRGSVRISR